MRPRPRFYTMTAALAVLAGAVSLTACASGQGSGQPAAPASAAAASGGAQAASGGSPAAAGATQVSSALKARVQALLANPTGIGRTTPLTHKPATDKFIVGIGNPISTSLVTGSGQAAGARLLGWKYETIQEGTGPEDPEQALNLAIAMKPSGIIYYTSPRQSMAAGLAKAKAAGIPIVTSATPDANPPAAPIIAQYNDSAAQLAPIGVGLADYVAVNSNLSANVALVTLPVYSVLGAFDTSFQRELKATCSRCTITQVPQQLTDLGTNTPSSVVNAIRRNPSINYVIFDCGCAAAGVTSALHAAGLNSVILGGEGPLTPSIKEMQEGDNEVWGALPLESMGFGLIDTFARYFNGQSLSPIVTEPPQWQLLTRTNIASAHFDSQDNYIGYPDFASAWAKLWKAN
jgi:ABC-type sugar transport system substrate-binding protein